MSRVHETVRYGGQRVADSPGVPCRGTLARTASDAAFAHRTRVWRDPGGVARGEWYDNGPEGEKAAEPRRGRCVAHVRERAHSRGSP
jgi:hypothetical protein